MRERLTDFERGQLHELKHLSVYGKEFINMHGFKEYVLTSATLVDNKRKARNRPDYDRKNNQAQTGNRPVNTGAER